MHSIIHLAFASLISACLTLSSHASPSQDTSFASIESAVAKIRAGEKPTPQEIAAAAAERETYYQSLVKKYNSSMTTKFSKQDQADLFIVSMKMVLVDFEEYSDWVFVYALRFQVVDEMMKRTPSENDPFVHFCGIFSSLSRHKLDHALSCFRHLQRHDTFLANIAAAWVESHIPECDTKERFMAATAKT